MSAVFAYLWRHPRRTGFIALNVAVLVSLVGWGVFTAGAVEDGIGALPTLMLGFTGMTLLAVLWVVAWIAWAWLVAKRRLDHAHE